MSDPATALIVVDVQNDFCPGGALGVAGGDRLGPAIAAAAEQAGTLVATRDRHPAGHVSFAERGGPWPPHCVAGTPGADLHASVGAMRFESPVNVTSGCRRAITPAISPAAIAANSLPTTSLWLGSGFGRADATARRAREANCRADASLMPSTEAISPKGTAKPSCRTNATR